MDCASTNTNQEILEHKPDLLVVDGGKINKGLVPSPVKTSPQKNGICTNSSFHFQQSNTGCESLESMNYDNITYEAESPDEAALVRMASSYGFKLISRSPQTVTILIPNEGQVTFQVLHVLAFDSTRKRMSVIVRQPPAGPIVMYCKGTDSVVMERLSRDHWNVHQDQTDGGSYRLSVADNTQIHLNVYARDGLRTLCMARKVNY